jgi:hypothetical protein
MLGLGLMSTAGCGNGPGSAPAAGGNGEITGLIVKGRVGAATVTAYRLDSAMSRGTVLATAASAADGTFTLTVPPYNGHIELVATGGSYDEEAVGATVQLARELSAVFPEFQSGGTVTLTVSPMSTLARNLAKSRVDRGAALVDALSQAWSHVNGHFGNLDWRSVVPTNLTPAEPVTVTLSDDTKAGLVLAGLSQAARVLAESGGLSPGTQVTGSTLAGAGADDAKDGTLDGVWNGTTLKLAESVAPLNGHTFRRSLGQGILKFVQSSRNKTQLTTTDVLSIASAIAANSDPYLFCPNEVAAPACAGGSLDLTAPIVTLIDPPTYVATESVTLRVTATQSEVGIQSVHAQTAAGDRSDGALSDGVWTIANVPLAPGSNTVTVWAVDRSGAGTQGNGVKIVIVRDQVAPAPYRDPSVASYYDERDMTLASVAVPVAYRFPDGAAKVDPLAPGGAYKAATRIAWTATPTPAVLETTNPDNIPFVRISVPVSEVEAPITLATYSASLNGGEPVTGDLSTWWSPTSTSSVSNYDLPLASNLFPGLATIAGPIVLNITISMTDAAGNTGTFQMSGALHVIGPPLVIEEDTGWTAVADPKGTFFYPFVEGRYAALWDRWNSSLFGGTVRLARYVLSNPAPTPVALVAGYDQLGDGSWKAIETWAATVGPPLGTTAYASKEFSANGVSLYTYAFFWTDTSDFTWHNHRSPYSGSWFFPSSGWPCPVETYNAGGVPRHRWDYTSANWELSGRTCYTARSHYEFAATPMVTGAGPVATEVYSSPIVFGGEVTPATPIGGYVTVPAATEDGPGKLVVYLTRPVTQRHVDAPVMTRMPWDGTTYTYGGIYETVYPPHKYGSAAEAIAYNVTRTLSAARETIGGQLRLSTAGRAGSAVFGEPAAHVIAVDKTIVH